MRCRYLRIRLTDHCNLQCQWCHNEGGQGPKSRSELSSEQIRKAVSLLAGFGFKKIKLAGGEPTLRPDLEAVIRSLSEIPDIDLSMITNGTLLTSQCLSLYKHAGLSRINISLNTFDPARFRTLQRGNDTLLQSALDSIPRIIAGGYSYPKLNFLYLGTESDDDLDSVIQFAQTHKVKVTLLNLIPVSFDTSYKSSVTTANLIDKVVSLGVDSIYVDNDLGSFSTLCFVLHNGVVLEIGHHQVGQTGVYRSCTRCHARAYCRESVFAQRLTPDGFLQPCLIRDDNRLDLRPYLLGEIDRDDATQKVTAFLGEL